MQQQEPWARKRESQVARSRFETWRSDVAPDRTSDPKVCFRSPSTGVISSGAHGLARLYVFPYDRLAFSPVSFIDCKSVPVSNANRQEQSFSINTLAGYFSVPSPSQPRLPLDLPRIADWQPSARMARNNLEPAQPSPFECLEPRPPDSTCSGALRLCQSQPGTPQSRRAIMLGPCLRIIFS